MSDKNKKELTEAELASAAGGTSDHVRDAHADSGDRGLTDPPEQTDGGDSPVRDGDGGTSDPTTGRGSIG